MVVVRARFENFLASLVLVFSAGFLASLVRVCVGVLLSGLASFAPALLDESEINPVV